MEATIETCEDLTASVQPFRRRSALGSKTII